MNDFERILTTLRSAEVSFIIIGGVAATVHGSARLTSDIDVVYERPPARPPFLCDRVPRAERGARL